MRAEALRRVADSFDRDCSAKGAPRSYRRLATTSALIQRFTYLFVRHDHLPCGMKPGLVFTIPA